MTKQITQFGFTHYNVFLFIIIFTKFNYLAKLINGSNLPKTKPNRYFCI